ncbi:MAG: nucleotidyltransferase family protein [Nitrospinaceae bacterium]
MNLSPNRKKYDAILVAGEGESSYKVYHQHKAFLKINGKSIINYVVEALQQTDSIANIYIVGLEDKLRQTLEEGHIDLKYPKTIRIVQQKNNLFENIWQTFLNTIPGYENISDLESSPYRDKAVLIVPCDSPLITPHEIEHFISHCDTDQYDHILGLTAEENLKPFYPAPGKPGLKMSYLHLSEKSFRVNNLHLVKPLRIGNREYIQKMYQYRYQRNFKNFVLFGLSLFGKDKAEHYQYYLGLQLGLLFAGLGLSSPVDFFRKWTPKKNLERCISTIMKTRFMGLEVPYPGAALDIDNDKDYEALANRFNEWRDYLQRPEHSLPCRSEYSV